MYPNPSAPLIILSILLQEARYTVANKMVLMGIEGAQQACVAVRQTNAIVTFSSSTSWLHLIIQSAYHALESCSKFSRPLLSGFQATECYIPSIKNWLKRLNNFMMVYE
jgi:hypothetical protein